MWSNPRTIEYPNYTHPVKEDVKEKILSPPLTGTRSVVTYIQPSLPREELST